MLEQPISSLNGIGEKRAKLYHQLGIDTLDSLLHFYPRTYLDLTHQTPIKELQTDLPAVVKATVIRKFPSVVVRGGLRIFKLLVHDGSDSMMITIFNSRFLFESLVLDQEYLFYGKPAITLTGIEMASPQSYPTSGIALFNPTYPLTSGLTNKGIQQTIGQVFSLCADEIKETLPETIRRQYKLCPLNKALYDIHFPMDDNALEQARNRLIFEELLLFQLGLLKMKSGIETISPIHVASTDLSGFYNQLPFALTGAQLRVIEDCVNDLRGTKPMNRLVQGDVGSGKTMVAIAAAYLMAQNGYQSVLMAPTEILAAQHYHTFTDTLEGSGIHCCLLTGAATAKQKRLIYADCQAGNIQILIGTHAVISQGVEFANLGLVITDEQHRFGVNQRGQLQQKGSCPHTIVMSATPIPRTLALILYGDLDISVIDEMPKGRQTIETFAVDGSKRARALSFLKKQLDKGRQAYIVCPAVEETQTDLVSVGEYAAALKETPLRAYPTAVLHGKLSSKEKDAIMQQFKNNEIKLLVATTVIEVGIDVPNATVMMVENSERFGLSQLHQLRGRVGRGSEQSYCILVSERSSDSKRLQVLCETSDGFAVAQEDLKLRGPGDFFGAKQHGLPLFKLANLSDNMEQLEQIQALARQILALDPDLSSPDYQQLEVSVTKLFEQNEQQNMN